METLHDVIEAIVHKIPWHSEAEKAEVLETLDDNRPPEPAPPPKPVPPPDLP